MSQEISIPTAQSSDAPQRSGQILGWIVFARLLLLGVYAQSIFAGVYLSGKIWGRDAHEVNAMILVLVTVVAGLVALVTLRGVAGGKRFAISMIGFAIALVIQMAIGEAVADGERLLWIHIPFGVALVGFSAEMATVARRLGR